jgi:hypothetical protein
VIVLTWTDNSDNEEVFIIEYGPDGSNWEPLTKVKPDSVEYIVEKLRPTTTYYFRILAANGNGSSAWDTANATTLESPTSPPAQPTGLEATALGEYAIGVAWTDNSSTEEGYIIEWNPGGEGWTTLDKLDPDTVSYKIGRLKEGVSYGFRVFAYNSNGESLRSNEDYATAVETVR